MSRIKYSGIYGMEKYEVGSDGSVWSLNYNNTGKRKQLRHYLDQDGYPYLFFVINGTRYKRVIHRLVALSFLTRPSLDHQVNHKNGIRNDNRLENLEWVTHQENVIHGWRSNGRKLNKWQREEIGKRTKGIGNPKAKITQEIAENIREVRKTGVYLKDIAKQFNISIAQISAICSGRFWK